MFSFFLFYANRCLNKNIHNLKTYDSVVIIIIIRNNFNTSSVRRPIIKSFTFLKFMRSHLNFCYVSIILRYFLYTYIRRRTNIIILKIEKSTIRGILFLVSIIISWFSLLHSTRYRFKTILNSRWKNVLNIANYRWNH